MQSEKIFNHLIIGLMEFLGRNEPLSYPYPETWQKAYNALAQKMLPHFPPTLHGTLTFFEKPLNDWWPSDCSIPPEYHPGFPLLENRQISEEASAYYFEWLFETVDFNRHKSSERTKVELDNQIFRAIFQELWEIWLQSGNPEEAERAQHEYVLFRRFLIENPYATTSLLVETFGSKSYITSQKVGQLYDDCKDTRGNWQCKLCGPLHFFEGQLIGIRQSLCGNHFLDSENVRHIPFEHGLRRINTSTHWRVSFPGVPEILLFQEIEKLQKQYPSGIKEISLWPGIDRYDLQISFHDNEVWAIDIKDSSNPYGLTKNIKIIYGEGSLTYDKGFYVISERALAAKPDYLRIIRQEGKLLPDHQVLGFSEFITKVHFKITSLKSLKKKK